MSFSRWHAGAATETRLPMTIFHRPKGIFPTSPSTDLGLVFLCLGNTTPRESWAVTLPIRQLAGVVINCLCWRMWTDRGPAGHDLLSIAPNSRAVNYEIKLMASSTSPDPRRPAKMPLRISHCQLLRFGLLRTNPRDGVGFKKITTSPLLCRRPRPIVGPQLVERRRRGMMVSGHRVYPTSSRYLITERHESAVAFIGCDAAASNSADVPLRTRRWPPPVVGSDESQPPCELVVGHHEQCDRASRRGHIRDRCTLPLSLTSSVWRVLQHLAARLSLVEGMAGASSCLAALSVCAGRA
jgi:hypothetical protein